jgi:uncharacterized phiE125 gp8 family phage protein
MEVGMDDTPVLEKMKMAEAFIADTYGIASTTTTYRTAYDPCDFVRGWVPLTRDPLIALTSVTYYDADDAVQTVDLADIDAFALLARPAVVRRKDGQPIFPYAAKGGLVQFTAGHGALATTIPLAAKQAILLLGTAWYENRSELTEQNIKVIPAGVDSLLFNLRLF